MTSAAATSTREATNALNLIPLFAVWRTWSNLAPAGPGRQ